MSKRNFFRKYRSYEQRIFKRNVDSRIKNKIN
jgi:hypothetical protein